MKAVSPREFLGDRPAPRACALAACVAMIAWASWIAGRHGVLPAPIAEIEQFAYDRFLDRQDADSLLDFAKWQGSSEADRTLQQMVDSRFFADIDERIEQHRLMARGEARPPAGESSDLSAFLASEAPRLPAWARVGLAHVRTQTILFRPGETCEMLCSTSEPAEKVYEEYIARLVEARWAVESNMIQFHPVDRRGYFYASHGDDAGLFVAVMDREVFAGAPTTIYWKLQGTFTGRGGKP